MHTRGQAELTSEQVAFVGSREVEHTNVHVACTEEETRRGDMKGRPHASQGGSKVCTMKTKGRVYAQEVVQG